MSETPTQGYQVLARKYRPETFTDLVGQEAMVRTLRNALEADRIARARSRLAVPVAVRVAHSTLAAITSAPPCARTAVRRTRRSTRRRWCRAGSEGGADCEAAWTSACASQRLSKPRAVAGAAPLAQSGRPAAATDHRRGAVTGSVGRRCGLDVGAAAAAQGRLRRRSSQVGADAVALVLRGV